MIKWNITSRHHPSLSTERFYYEWAVIHVALMVTNASTMRCFKRYVQHFAYDFEMIPDEARLLPLHETRWQSFAEHWIEGLHVIPPAVGSEDYRGRMHPHSFSDSTMELHLLQGTTAYERPDFKSGGVKLIHNLKLKPGVDVEQFNAFLVDKHAALVVDLLKERGLRKYEIDRQLGLDPNQFKGTLFEKGGVDQYAGLEEFWFDSLEDALAFGKDPKIRQALLESYGQFVDIQASHSIYMTERVAFDFVTREATPPPAILNPDSCEARTCYDDWKCYLPSLAKPEPHQGNCYRERP
ncbi:MAG: hypothetical protein H6Q00_1176 [Holophagaceae bacterium]|nr:hypothetical protein [Holophagaceae bacterium]